MNEISTIDIKAIIPQREPFVMVDYLTSAEGEIIESVFTIRPENIFLESGVLREFALIENIAQSSAAGLAIINRKQADAPSQGFIGAINNLEVFRLPELNDTIHTVVKLRTQFENMFLLRGTAYLNDEKLLECDIKLVGK